MITEKERLALEQLNTTKQKIKQIYDKLEKLIAETKYDIERSLETFDTSVSEIQDDLDYEIDFINETFDNLENMDLKDTINGK